MEFKAESLAPRIKLARDIRGLSQSELAEKIGVVVQQVSKYERGVDYPTIKRLEAIAEATNFPLYWFLLESTGVKLLFPPEWHDRFWARVRQVELEEFAARDEGIDPSDPEFKFLVEGYENPTQEGPPDGRWSNYKPSAQSRQPSLIDRVARLEDLMKRFTEKAEDEGWEVNPTDFAKLKSMSEGPANEQDDLAPRRAARKGTKRPKK